MYKKLGKGISLVPQKLDFCAYKSVYLRGSTSLSASRLLAVCGDIFRFAVCFAQNRE